MISRGQDQARDRSGPLNGMRKQALRAIWEGKTQGKTVFTV